MLSRHSLDIKFVSPLAAQQVFVMCSTQEPQTSSSGIGKSAEVISDTEPNPKAKNARFCAPLSGYFSFEWLSNVFYPVDSNECSSAGFTMSSHGPAPVVSTHALPRQPDDSDLFHIESSGIRHSLSLGENTVRPFNPLNPNLLIRNPDPPHTG